MGSITTAEMRKKYFICVTAVYFAEILRVMMRYTAHVSTLSTANVMPSKSFFPVPLVHDV